MPDKRKVTARHTDKQHGDNKQHRDLTPDVKTARRFLAWVNAAKRPEDLLRPPEALTHLHVEYRTPGFPERHMPADEDHEHGPGDKHPGDIDRKFAAEIL